jgi:8-oxo-dGDP phosphatase
MTANYNEEQALQSGAPPQASDRCARADRRVAVVMWQTLATRVAYRSPLFLVREDQVIRPDGEAGCYAVIEMPAAVGIVAVDEDGKVALVSQWRYPHRRMSLEIPTGAVEGGEDVLDAAARELAEETGLVASRWRSLGTIDTSNGSTTEVAHLFQAESLSLSPPVDGDPIERTQLSWLDLEEAVRLAVRGDIVEAASVAALFRARYGLCAP